jgi:N-acetyl-gamma-glutamyl-phosphate reductase
VPEAAQRGIRVIDLSGAWRLQDAANRAVYAFEDEGSAVAVETQTHVVYGMPELHRAQIAGATLVANPGCYATSVILALAPFAQAGLIDTDRGIICDAKSGVSGAGKAATPKTHFMYAADNLSAYAVFGHRHTGELLEQLHLQPEQIVFTPHLLPIPRGILSTPLRSCCVVSMQTAQWCGFTRRALCRRSSTACTRTTRTSALRWPRTASGW